MIFCLDVIMRGHNEAVACVKTVTSFCYFVYGVFDFKDNDFAFILK